MSRVLDVNESFYIDGYAAAISNVQKSLEILKTTVGLQAMVLMTCSTQQ